MSPQVLGVFVPIIAIVLGMAVAVVTIMSRYRLRSELWELRHRERLVLIEKGLELPPETLDPFASMQRPRPLLRGLVLLFVGVAITVAVHEDQSFGVSYLFGMVPAAAGLGYLVYYAIEGRHEAPSRKDAVPPDSSPPI